MLKIFKSGIESNYSISSNPLFINEPWSVYPASHRSTKKKCSVFIFNKKQFEALLNQRGFSKNRTLLPEIMDKLKRHITNLTKIRHPNILTVLEPLEERKSRLLFVTEYVCNDLATCKVEEMDEIIKLKGLSQLSGAIKFLHQSAEMVHLNIQPKSVLINENMDWKLSGLEFVQAESTDDYFLDSYDFRMPSWVNLNLDFSSPELVLQHRLTPHSDLFSLGCLIYFLFAHNKLMVCEENSDYEREWKKVEVSLSSRPHVILTRIPEKYWDAILGLLSNQAYSIDSFLDSKIFQDELLKALQKIDELHLLNHEEKYHYLLQMREIINKFPKVLLLNKILPTLIDQAVILTQLKKINQDEEKIIGLYLENIILSSKDFSLLAFSDKVFPHFASFLALDLVCVKEAFLTHFSIIESHESSNKDKFRKFLTLLFEKSLSDPSSADPQVSGLHAQALTLFPSLIKHVSYSDITGILFPKVCETFTMTTSLKLKNLCMMAFTHLVGGSISDNVKPAAKEKVLDTLIIVDKLLPILENTSTQTLAHPRVFSVMVDLYYSIFSKMSNDKVSSFTLGGKSVTNYDVILESIFFRLWKLLQFVQTTQDFENLKSRIASVEDFLYSNVGELRQGSPQAATPDVKLSTVRTMNAPEMTTSSVSTQNTRHGAMSTPVMTASSMKTTPMSTPIMVTPNASTPVMSASGLRNSTLSPKVESPAPNNTAIDWSTELNKNRSKLPPGFSEGVIKPNKHIGSR